MKITEIKTIGICKACFKVRVIEDSMIEANKATEMPQMSDTMFA